jgi:hypothetical protein
MNRIHSNDFDSCREEHQYKTALMSFNVWCCTAISEKDVMVFQSYMNSENVLVGPYGETYQASHDADQAMNVRTEAVSDAEEEEDPVPIKFQRIKADPEVSCVCTLRQITQMCRSVA